MWFTVVQAVVVSRRSSRYAIRHPHRGCLLAIRRSWARSLASSSGRGRIGSRQDELLSSILQASVARVNLAENEDVRKISAWVAIAAVPTAVAGIYGMNFTNMPELHWSFGYPLVMGIVLVICLVLYLRFKRSGWL